MMIVIESLSIVAGLWITAYALSKRRPRKRRPVISTEDIISCMRSLLDDEEFQQTHRVGMEEMLLHLEENHNLERR